MVSFVRRQEGSHSTNVPNSPRRYTTHITFFIFQVNMGKTQIANVSVPVPMVMNYVIVGRHYVPGYSIILCTHEKRTLRAKIAINTVCLLQREVTRQAIKCSDLRTHSVR